MGTLFSCVPLSVATPGQTTRLGVATANFDPLAVSQQQSLVSRVKALHHASERSYLR